MTRATFEEPKTSTLAHWTGSRLHLWRRKKHVAEVIAFHGISFSRNGRVLIHGNELHDLASRSPEQRKQLVLAEKWLSNEAALHPNGDRILLCDDGIMWSVRWQKEVPLRKGADSIEYERGGIAEKVCPTSLTHPTSIKKSLFDVIGAPLPKTKKKLKTYELIHQVFVSADASTWIVGGGSRLAIGKGKKLIADLVWRETEPLDFVTIDSERDRVLRGGEAGVVAFSLRTGQVLAATKLTGIVAPVVIWRGHLAAVVAATPGNFHTSHDVIALDLETLAPRGRFAFRPTEAREGALLPLADGSLAWLLGKSAPLFLRDDALGELPARLRTVSSGDGQSLAAWWSALPPRTKAAIEAKAGLAKVKKPSAAALAKAKEIDVLALRAPTMDDLVALGSLSRLRVLGLKGELASLEPLTKLTGLVHLDLSGANVKDTSALDKLSGLKELVLYETRVKDFAFLTKMDALEWLDLYGTGIDDVAPLRGLKKLQRLRLGNCPDLESLAPLAKLSALQDLDASHTGVSSLAPLAQMKALRTVLLEGMDHLNRQMTTLQRKRPKLRISTAD